LKVGGGRKLDKRTDIGEEKNVRLKE